MKKSWTATSNLIVVIKSNNTNEIILYSNFEYIFNETTNEIESHDPNLVLPITFGSHIIVGTQTLDSSPFGIHESSKIEVINNATTSSLIITVVLVSSSDKLYTFSRGYQLNF